VDEINQQLQAVCDERLAVIDELKATCDERLELIERLQRELDLRGGSSTSADGPGR
jgi:hypothetical protein